VKWFQVDSDTPNDPKVRAIIRQLGNDGFGGLVRLWCHIANHGARPGWSVNTAGKPIPLEELIEASGLDPAKFEQLVLISVQIGHFEKRPWDSRQVIAIPAMARRADTYTKRTVRTGFEHASKRVQSNFANKTVHTKQTKYPPTPLKGGEPRLTRAELAQAKQARDRVHLGCPHAPRCPNADACVRALALEARHKGKAS
jgi:hypothetical protein